MKYIAAILIVLTLSSCEFFRKLDKGKTDTTSVKTKETEVKSGDTTKVTTKATNEWERWTFAPRDTNVININLPKQSYPAPIIYERGSGSQTQQVDMGVFENWKQRFQDSLKFVEQFKKSETKGSILSVGQLIIIGLIIFLILCILVLIFFFQNKISTIIKNIPK